MAKTEFLGPMPADLVFKGADSYSPQGGLYSGGYVPRGLSIDEIAYMQRMHNVNAVDGEEAWFDEEFHPADCELSEIDAAYLADWS